MRKHVFEISDQVRHKLGCVATEACTFYVAKTKVLFSWGVTVQQIYIFVYAYAKQVFS